MRPSLAGGQSVLSSLLQGTSLQTRMDWVIETHGDDKRYMTLYGWAPRAEMAMRFTSSEDADAHIRRFRIPNALPVTVASVEHAARCGASRRTMTRSEARHEEAFTIIPACVLMGVARTIQVSCGRP